MKRSLINNSGSTKKVKTVCYPEKQKVDKSIIGKPLRAITKKTKTWKSHVDFLVKQNQNIFLDHGKLLEEDVEYAFDAVLDKHQEGDWIIKAGTYDEEECEFDTENPYDDVISLEDYVNPELGDIMFEIQEKEDSSIFDAALKQKFFARLGIEPVTLPRCRSSYIIGL